MDLGSCSGCCKYLPQVPMRLSFLFILNNNNKIIITNLIYYLLYYTFHHSFVPARLYWFPPVFVFVCAGPCYLVMSFIHLCSFALL